jgi:hypothetical protein
MSRVRLAQNVEGQKSGTVTEVHVQKAVKSANVVEVTLAVQRR